MYSNYFAVDLDFINHFEDEQREQISDFAYSIYCKCLRPKSKKLSKDDYLKSNRVHYSLAYTYCPKCKRKGFIINHLTKKYTQGFKFCPSCGEPNITHRFTVGKDKIVPLLVLSKHLEENDIKLSEKLNQQLVVSICSVYEVYLREFYADILNTKFIRSDFSLYDKFLNDCKNDFLNPGKTQSRLKKELDIDYKKIIGADEYKFLSLWSDYRNVVVHNNGICDRNFINNYPEIELRSEVAPKWKSVAVYLQVVESCIKKLDAIYSETILEFVVHELKMQSKLTQLKIRDE